MLELMVLNGQPAPDLIPDEAFLSAIGTAHAMPDRYRFPFSYVVDKATMLPVEPILRYLTFSASTRSNTEVTIRNKAHACYELFLYLDALELNYQDVCLDTLIEYKERLCAFISPRTKRPLKPGTIKMRLHIARDFCAFHGILPASETLKLKGKPIAGHAPSKLIGQAAALNIATPNALVEYLGTKDLRKLLEELGDWPGDQGGRPSRDRLLCTFCVSTGVRLAEALGLEIHQIYEARLDYDDRLNVSRDPNRTKPPRILLTKTKNLNPRQIDVPPGLIDMLIKYIDGERKDAVAIGMAHRRRTRETRALFVNGRDCVPRYAGLPYRAKRAEECFAACQKRIGLTRTVAVYNLDSRVKTGEQIVNKHTIHHLRHTYAIEAWNSYRHLPETDRWILIQQQLGHKSHEITANIYLRAVKHSEGRARDMLSGVFKSLIASR